MFVVKRAEENPLLTPQQEHPWEAAAVFNWCPVQDKKKIHVLYRALSHRQLLEDPKIHRSIIARATTEDNIHYTGRTPFIVPDTDYDRYGCEDPRVTKIDGKYYTFYTALSTYPFSAEGIRVAVAVSRDLKTVEEKHLVTPFNAKAFALFPEKINGKYVALLTIHTDLPDTRIAVATFTSLDEMWSPTYWEKWYKKKDSFVIPLHRSDDEQVEVGAVPIKTEEGWLLIYSHATHYFSRPDHIFGVEAVLLDLKNPQKIIGRTPSPFMVPEMYYEKMGLVPNIVFPSGALKRGKKLDIYYGAADTVCAKATIELEHLLRLLRKKPVQYFTRHKKNPIIAPRDGKDWEAHGTFNPAALDFDKTVRIVYRAMSTDETGTFGYAESPDGVTITERSEDPIYVPRADFENKKHPGNSGCEDPRLVSGNGTVYMTYTAFDGEVPRVAISTISEKDFKNKNWNAWSMPTILTPMNYPNKDAAIIPKKTRQGYVFIHRVDNSICADTFATLDFNKERVTKCIEMLSVRPGMWDNTRIGIANPPIETKYGWILFYHGISESHEYRVGAALLDKDDPTIVLSRTALPLFEPIEPYEKDGIVSNVVFPCGHAVRNDTVYLYYGGADKVVGVAVGNLSDILNLLRQ